MRNFYRWSTSADAELFIFIIWYKSLQSQHKFALYSVAHFKNSFSFFCEILDVELNMWSSCFYIGVHSIAMLYQ